MAQAFSIYGAIASGKAARDLAKYNAEISKRQGEAAVYQSKIEADRLRRQGARALAELAAGQVGGGLGVSRAVLTDQAFEIARDVQYTLWQGKYASYLSTARADTQRYEGQVSRFSSNLQAAGSFASLARDTATAGIAGYVSGGYLPGIR